MMLMKLGRQVGGNQSMWRIEDESGDKNEERPHVHMVFSFKYGEKSESNESEGHQGARPSFVSK